MSDYNATREMVESTSLQKRITGAVAEKGVLSPEQWTRDQSWYLATDEEWVSRWSDANFNYNPMLNPNTGERPDVITDAIIERAVQDRIDFLASIEPGSV